ncbi:GTPase domain-containing protein [Intrasporangium chromatireducens]|uniref:GTPase domain-containing protein n=1 Tax=Intrasporangium chromatireducens TaxID=1386088 RepID=UPI0012DC5C98|nr:GTPase domain-containing protein [Intrasporangium chromatireducens]
MPIPLIVAVAAAALAAAGLLGKSLVDAARGKQIVVLGPRMTGKSTLTDFLHTGQIRRQYIPTQARREFKCDVKLETVGLKLKIIDFSGDKSAWKDAREKARNAD